MKSVFINLFLVLPVLGASVISASAFAQFGEWDPEPEPEFPFLPIDPTPPPTPLPPPPPSNPTPPPPSTTSGSGAVLFIGQPGNRPYELEGYGISTQQVDAAIDPFSAQTGIPAGYLTSEANKAFAEIEQTKAKLLNEFRAGLEESVSVIDVKSLQLNTNPLRATLYQTGTRFNAELGNISGSAKVKVDVGFFGNILVALIGGCINPTATVEIVDMKLKAEYDVFTGALMDTGVDFNTKEANFKCGFFFPTTKVALALFGLDLLINERRLTDKILRGLSRKFFDPINQKTLFSVRETLEGLREYADRVENYVAMLPPSVTVNPGRLGNLIPNIGNNPIVVRVPQYSGDISDSINEVIDTGLAVTGGFGGTSLQLDVVLFDGTAQNAPSQLSFIASHRAPRLNFFEYFTSGIFTSVTAPANTGNVSLFAKSQYSNNWYQTSAPGASSGGSERHFRLPTLEQHSRVVAIGESTLINGLRSYPSNQRTSTWDFYCHLRGGGGTCPEFY